MMNSDFAQAMRRALDRTRAGSLNEVTAGIQAALSGQPWLEEEEGGVAQTPAPRSDGALPHSKHDGDHESPIPPKAPRRSLKQVVEALMKKRPSGLASLLSGTGRRAPSAPPEIPERAEFQSRTFASAQGTRAYKLYVPGSRADGVRGLVVMLHGCTQTPEDFAAGTGMNEVAERVGLLIAYPAQTKADNSSACWNWFRPGDQLRGQGEPAILAGLTRALISEFAVDPEMVFVAGFSAGGAMAAVMAATYPDLFAADGVHSGLAHGAASDVVSAFAAMRGEARPVHSTAGRSGDRTAVRSIVFHGRADRTVHVVNGERVMRANGQDLARAEAMPTGVLSERTVERRIWRTADGMSEAELWLIEGAGHAWAGGRPEGSYTDPAGPDASAEMIRFFLNEARRGAPI